VSFAPGSAVLPANAASLLKPYCLASAHLTITGHATVDAHDPSSAMRLSLARALAVQSALTQCGVPAQNLIPKALGAAPKGGDDNATYVAGGPS